MTKKLTRHGNSLALIIDRPILELLKIDPDTELDVSTDGKRLVIAPVDLAARRKKFDEVRADAHKRYAETFRQLAK
jgi:antitoxin MazE